MSAATARSKKREAPSSLLEASERPAGETWPRGISREPVMKIGQVVALLKVEFPALSISKVRYLEGEGLISPHRVGNGYRRYSQADLERLRYALAVQRDEYLPLHVIRERLARLDADVEAPSLVQILGMPEDSSALAGAARLATHGRLDAESFQRVLAPVEGGLSLLGGLGRAGRWRELPPAAMTEVWLQCRRAAAWTVVDVAGGPAAGPGEALVAVAEHDALAGAMAWEALRIEAGLPRWAREVDARAIPNELDWLRTGVHLNKGCYPGQETIARTVNLGRPPRRLVQLQLAGWQGQLPEVGARVYLPAGDNPAGKAVGTITSVARHWELGNIALALVRRGVPAQAELAVDLEDGYESASQELLVDPAGKAEASPSQRPGLGLKRLRPEHG